MKKYLLGSFILVLSLIIPDNEAFAKKQKPLIWDMTELEQLKHNINSESAHDIIITANKYISLEPVVVTDKKKTFAPNNHYYCSVGIYWWPDPARPGKYIQKDGVTNPESMEYDGVRLSELGKRCVFLSKAFYLTRNKQFFNAFVSQIKAWFIDEGTYMLPNFEYTQVIPGDNNNKGRRTGFIDAYGFNAVLESIRLTNSVKKIDKKTMRALQCWFYDFAEWCENNYGIELSKENNNISLSYDVTMIDMYIFANKKEKAMTLAESFAEKRIITQINEDGSQPAELKRTKAFTYSVANLSQIIDFCYLVRYWDKNYYDKYGERVERAFEYLQTFSDDPSTFPYKQMTEWNSSIESFNVQKQRRNVLKSRTR